VLGDSFAEAFQVPLENTFWSVLERKLRECRALSGRDVEVMNFGVSGFGTTQELLTYREYARKYEPDFVLLAFFPGNDLRDNLRSLSESAGPSALVKPFYRVSNGELILDNSFLNQRPLSKRFPGWFEQLRVVQLTDVVVNWTKYRSLSSVDNRALVSPPDTEYAKAWTVTETVLKQLNQEVQSDGAHLIVLTVSTSQQVDPDPARSAEWARAAGVLDLFYPDKRLYYLSRAAGFQMVPLAPAMAQVAQETGRYLHGFWGQSLGGGHWNHNGHLVAGEILAHELCGRLETVESSHQ
jgi:hypothetical protein